METIAFADMIRDLDPCVQLLDEDDGVGQGWCW